MNNTLYDLFFLNPTNLFFSKINEYLLGNNYSVLEKNEEKRVWKYKKNASLIEVNLCEDHEGQYIAIECNNVLPEKIIECLSVCPECGSDNLKVSVFIFWRNDVTEKLYEEGRLTYGPVAYDRFGTRPETNTCLECGCKWHNEAAIYRWDKIVSEGRQLIKKDLGLK